MHKRELLRKRLNRRMAVLCVLYFVNYCTLFLAASEQPLPDVPLSSWRSEHFCKAELKDGILQIDADNGSPVLSRFCTEIGGQFRVTAEIKTQTESSVQLSWTTKGSPRRDKEKSLTMPVQADENWKRYEFVFSVPDALTSLAFQFSAAEGTWEIKSVSLFRSRSSPLSVQDAVQKTVKDSDGAEQTVMQYTVYNNAPVPILFRVNEQAESISVTENQTTEIMLPVKSEGCIDFTALVLHPEGFPDVSYPVFRYNPKGKTEWKTFTFASNSSGAGFELDISSHGDIARLRNGQEVFAVIAPLVHRNGIIPDFTLSKESTDNTLKFESSSCTLEIQLNKGAIRFIINDLAARSPSSVSNLPHLEGPCVRLFGELHSGLLPGTEFLGKGDVSSSTVDLEEPFNLRDTPNPQWLTMPLAVLATEKGSVMLQWNHPNLQPVFSSPNQFDKTNDHRVSFIGTNIDATLHIFTPATTSDTAAVLPVVQALKQYLAENGLPDPPPAPRSSEEQRVLNLSALETLRSPDGTSWGYAVQADWKREPFADFLSTQTRLTGKLPTPKKIVSGGADIANDAVYFITGRVEEWVSVRKQAVQSILTLRQPDGSFLQRTRFPESEQKATSYGFTAIRTLELMEFVRLTGDKELFISVQKSLEYLKRCEVPRGGFYRDSPLHTPDLQTAATLVWLYSWAFEFSGEKEYLDSAQRFAYLGLPFVYLWNPGGQDSAIAVTENAASCPLLYAAVPKFGGTERKEPLWFGIARPETGILYAYSLNILSRHDKSVDWKRIATGILHTAEAAQYPNGQYAGCLPERFDTVKQERQSWKVNPCALVSLRLALEDKLDALSVLMDEKERYVSPYPLRLTPDGIEVYDIPEGIPSFQILRNGNRVETLNGTGTLLME